MIMTADSGPWVQLVCLLVAFVLCSSVGFERELRHKDAGLRTHALVGLGAALFMVVGKYGFSDVLTEGLVRLDPSRVAGQVASGVGFIGAGVIFVKRATVRGLTTAASIWVAAAIGLSAGAGLLVPAVAVTVAHFITAFVFPWAVERVPGLRSAAEHTLRVTYDDETGALRRILRVCTDSGLVLEQFSERRGPRPGVVAVELRVAGATTIGSLVAALSELEGVREVRRSAGDAEPVDERGEPADDAEHTGEESTSGEDADPDSRGPRKPRFSRG